ncbi:MAG: hypothetical protein FJ249_05595 [Nitrospira sp.]|nr:hypothetical protein [Nitrospira sp.]
MRLGVDAQPKRARSLPFLRQASSPQLCGQYSKIRAGSQICFSFPAFLYSLLPLRGGWAVLNCVRHHPLHFQRATGTRHFPKCAMREHKEQSDHPSLPLAFWDRCSVQSNRYGRPSMIKLMRDSAHKYPWLLKSIMGALAIAFVITMGWWGFEEQESNAVASVGDMAITRDEYRRSFESTYRFYKENVQGDFKEETLKQFVIDGLIENKIWLLAAKDMGLTVSPGELRDSILQRKDFQRNGKFDPDLYRRVLAANRLTPSLFESLYTVELLSQKAMTVVRDSVALTPAEIAEAQSLTARQTEAQPDAGPSASERILQDFLFQKQQRALMAYRESMKSRVPIQIHKELL